MRVGDISRTCSAIIGCTRWTCGCVRMRCGFDQSMRCRLESLWDCVLKMYPITAIGQSGVPDFSHCSRSNKDTPSNTRDRCMYHTQRANMSFDKKMDFTGGWSVFFLYTIVLQLCAGFHLEYLPACSCGSSYGHGRITLSEMFPLVLS